MNGYLIDTNVVSELVAPRPNAAVLARLAAIDAPLLSWISVQELAFGVERTPAGRRRDELTRFLAGVIARFESRLLGVAEPEARAAAEIRVLRERLGRRIDLADALIAGTARAHDLTVLTRNLADFDGVGLRLENPWA